MREDRRLWRRIALVCALAGTGADMLGKAADQWRVPLLVTIVLVGFLSGVEIYMHFVPELLGGEKESVGVPTPGQRKKFHDVLSDRYRNWVREALRARSPMMLYLEAERNAVAPALDPTSPEVDPLELDAEGVDAVMSSDHFISRICDATERHVLILGEPGAGKTTLLYRLAVALLKRSATDSERPLAVVFNLASWATKRQPLHEWLVEELGRKYRFSRSEARMWLNHIEILLDGLDEVRLQYRAACAEAINAFQKTHGLTPLTVSCRTAEYLDMTPSGGAPRVVKLSLRSAVQVLPLEDKQVARYLAEEGTQSAAVRRVIESDVVLREMMKTPLLLSMLLRAYEGQRPIHLRVEAGADALLAQLFDHYVDRMLVQPVAAPFGQANYQPEKVKQWLRWLADRLHENNQSELYLERLSPDWLFTRGFLNRRSLPPAWLIGVLFLGLLSAILAMTLSDPQTHAISWICGLLYGLVLGIAVGWSFKMEVSTTRIMSWSWLRAGVGFVAGFLVAMSNWLPMLLLALLALFLLFEAQELARRSWAWPAALTTWTRRPAPQFALLASGMVVIWLVLFTPLMGNGLTLGRLLTGLLLAIFAAVSSGQWDERGMLKRSPGIWRCAFGNAIAGVSVALAVILVGIGIQAHNAFGVALPDVLHQVSHLDMRAVLKDAFSDAHKPVYFLAAMALGITLPFFGGLAVVQYLILRYRLWQVDAGPWDYPGFLQYAVAHKLLQRISSGYRFIHISLRDHLAAQARAGE